MESCKVDTISMEALDVETYGGLNQLANLQLQSISLHSCSNCSFKSNFFWEKTKKLETLSLINSDIQNQDVLDISFKQLHHLTIIDCGNINSGKIKSISPNE